MSSKGSSKIIPIRRYGWLNIGTILFGAIFVYMLLSIFIYATNRKTATYEVTAGSVSGNYRYTALALKDETVISSDYSGSVTYYARDGARAGTGLTVCSVNSAVSAAGSPAPAELTSDDYTVLRKDMSSFSLNFRPDTFQDVYNFKADMEGYLLQAASTRTSGGTDLGGQMKAPSSGFVSYHLDGMENLTEADISEASFNRNQYTSENLRLHTNVKSGDKLYKLIAGEDWTLYFPLTAQLATELQDRTSIRFRFLKDDTTFQAGFTVLSQNGGYFGKITLHNSLVRYVSDRFVEIELLMSRRKGLKVPSSAIAEKVFFKVPADYVIPSRYSQNEITLIRERYDNGGEPEVRFITATVYDRQDGAYLVSTDLFEIGDYVQMADTSKRRQIVEDDLMTIQGVYNINKGYPVFRQVTVIDENEEFCIVDDGNIYGLAAHDYIVLDASTVREENRA